MAQAWHKKRAQLTLEQKADVGYWKADNHSHNSDKGILYPTYEVGNEEQTLSFSAGSDVTLEVTPGAVWERFNPFNSYRPPSGKGRQTANEAGPHLEFLSLKGTLEVLKKSKDSLEKKERQVIFEALMLFANRYGLLGLFQEYYLPWPILPKGKRLIAPEAILDKQGRLQQIDPLTRGKELRWRKLDAHKKFASEGYYKLHEDLEPTLTQTELIQKIEKEEHHRLVAAPSEIKFRRNLDPAGVGGPWSDETDFDLVPWAVIKEQFGAQLLLDPKSESGVSVVCTREPIDYWLEYLENFPSSEWPAKILARDLNSTLGDVSPHVLVGEDGALEGGWRCSSLLEAMYVMLFLDLTSDHSIKKCQRAGCVEYFRMGSQKSKYCGKKCANNASTRMWRGQKP